MDSLATTLLFAVILLGQVRLFCGVILRKCVNIHTTLSDIVILPPWVILLTYIILRVRVFSSTDLIVLHHIQKPLNISLLVTLRNMILLIGCYAEICVIEMVYKFCNTKIIELHCFAQLNKQLRPLIYLRAWDIQSTFCLCFIFKFQGCKTIRDSEVTYQYTEIPTGIIMINVPLG